jgi:acyl-CoA thioester hydrolase
MPPEGAFVAEHTVRVRFAETDLMGIVHHANYLVYFEAGRVEFLRQVGASYADLEAQGYSLAISELSVRYAEPCRFDQLITIRTWLEKVRSRGIAFGYQIVDAQSGQVCVTGRTDHICLDHEGQVKRLPTAWLKAMQQSLTRNDL